MEEGAGEEEKDCPKLENVSERSWLGHRGHRQSGEGQESVEINGGQAYGTSGELGEAEGSSLRDGSDRG